MQLSRLKLAGRGAGPLVALAITLCGAATAQQFGLPAMVRGVGIDQNLNAQLPLELTFKDEIIFARNR